MMRLAAAALIAAFAATPAFALTKQEADKAVAAFIAADGFTAVAEDAHLQPGAAYLNRFSPKPGDALLPDAEVGPIEKALLIVETMEATQPGRVRYAVSYGQVLEGDGQGRMDFISLVEVRRYNMGPLIHQQTQEEYGPENTAPVEEFGVGPDIAWRFAFSPVMGNLALPLSISRKVIGEGAEQLKDDPAQVCPAGPCRGLGGAYGFAAEGKAEPPKPAPTPEIGTPRYGALVGDLESDSVSTAHVARVLSAVLGLTDPAQPGVWRTPEAPEGGGVETGAPFIVFQFDQNLGNDDGTSALAGITRLADDDVAQLWAMGSFFGTMPPGELQTQIVRAR